MVMIDGREYTESLRLVLPMTTEAVNVKDFNTNFAVTDDTFSFGRVFSEISPGRNTGGETLVADINAETLVRDPDSGMTRYGDSFKIGCDLGISIDMDGETKEILVTHSNSIQSDQIGGVNAVPVLKWDGQGHLTSVSSKEILPPTTAGQVGQVWTAVGRPTSEAQRGAWAGISTDSLLSISVPTSANGEQASSDIVISHVRASQRDADAPRTNVGSSSKTVSLTYDEYGHVLSTLEIPMYPPTDKGIEDQVWLSVGTKAGNGRWAGQKTLDVGFSDTSRMTLSMVGSDSLGLKVGSGITPTHFEGGVPVPCARSIPLLSTSQNISVSATEDNTVSMSLTGRYTMSNTNVTGDDLINAKWAISKLSAKQGSLKISYLELMADGWVTVSSETDLYYTYEASIDDLGVNSVIWVCPERISQIKWYEHEVFTETQEIDRLVFRSTTKPSDPIKVKVAWAPKNS